MAKWIGQHIYDLVSRFRNDVYLEDISTGTIATGSHLGLDSNNKIVKSESESAEGEAGDLTSIVAGTGLSGTSLTGPIPTINIDAAQPTVTSLGTLTALAGGTGDLIWNTNTLVVDTSEAKVGIGTSSPAYTLDVAGIINTNSNYRHGGLKILGRESSNTVLEANGVNDIIFETNNTENVRITSAGKVGIGTTSPASLLHVHGGDVRISSANDAGSNLQFRNETTANALLSNSYNINSGSKTDFNTYVYGNNPYSIWTNNTNRLSITGAGNVGIGTSSPDKKLHLHDSSRVDIKFSNTGDEDHYIRKDGDYLRFRGHDDSAVLFELRNNSNGSNAASFPSGNLGIGLSAPTQALHLQDNKQIALGTGADLKIQHNGTNSEIGNSTGQLNIYNHADNSDINFMADDGSGGIETYFFLDGSLGRTVFPDNSRLVFGSSSDFDMRHYPSNGMFMNNMSDDFVISNYADDKDIIFKCDDGSGGVETYFFLDGSLSSGSPFTTFPDQSRANFGTGNDMQIYHDGTNTYMYNNGGDLKIMQAKADKDLILMCDDGSGGETAYLTLDGSAGYTTVQKRMRFDDAVELQLGASGDLTIKHDGSHNYILGATGNLHLQSQATNTDVIFETDDGAGGNAVYFRLDGSAATHDGSATTSLHTVWPDNSRIVMGTGSDFYMRHSGSDFLMSNATGTMGFYQQANDGDMKFYCDDGSGGNTAYLTLDGGLGFTTIQKKMRFADNIAVTLGAADDLSLFHDGTNSSITNAVGNLTIDTGHSDKDIIFKGTDGGADITALTLDMSDAGTALFNHDIRLTDNGALKVGSANDLQIFHDASNSYINNATGNLILQNNTDDGDIIFQSDDGSGGVADYFKLDGSVVMTRFSQTLNMFDNVKISIGTSQDLQVYHDATDNYIDSVNGDMYIRQLKDDKDIIFQSDDGSGGVETYFFLDGSFGSSPYTIFPDSSTLALGTGGDLRLYHDSSHSYIKSNGTGNIYIMQQNNDADISFWCDDGSGGDAEYFRLDGGLGWTVASKNIQFSDSIKASFGSSVDMIIQHNGTNSYIENATGNLEIINGQDDGDIIFKSDDGSGGIETYFFLDGSANGANPATVFPDNSSLIFGTGNDLYLRHTGTNSEIKNYVGDLIIANNANDKDIIFQSDDGSGGVTTYFQLDGGEGRTVFKQNALWEDSKAIYMGNGADLRLYHNGSNSFIESHTGNLTIDSAADDADIIFKGTDGGADITALTLDMSAAGQANFNSHVYLPDDARVKLGASHDLQMWHQSGNSFITNSTGNLYLINYADDKDIIFQSDDGSGGTTTYFQLDGSETKTIVSQTMEFQDNVKLAIGNSEDMTIDHNATDTRIMNYTGDLRILNAANDKDITFESDDGSGGVATYLTIDGSASQVLSSVTLKSTPPNANTHSLILGRSDTGNVWNVNHAGSDFRLYNAAGSGSDILFGVDSGSGAIANKVGIGVATPASLLHVAGTVQVGVDDTGHDVKFFGATSGRYLLWDESSDLLLHRDNVKSTFGNASDLQIFHDASNSYIYHGGTGNLYIKNETNDQDVVLQCDDGSGGVTAYLTLDGSTSRIEVTKNMRFADSVSLLLGGSSDLQLLHDGSNSYINAGGVGDLYIKQNNNDKDIIFQSDDGSGGVETYFFLDGSSGYTLFPDGKILGFGAAGDLTLQHDGNNSYINANGTGDLIIKQLTDDKDISFQCDNGSGGVTEYFRLDGGLSSPYTVFPDNSTLTIGTGFDLKMYHNGSNSYIDQTGTGNLYIRNTTDNSDIIFQSDDGNGGVTTYFTLDGSLANGTATYTRWADNDVITLGDSQDCYFYHNATNTYLYNNTGDLIIQNVADDKDIIFKSDDGSGGTTAYLTLDGGLGYTTVQKRMKFDDNTQLQFGTDGDLQFYHTGGVGVLYNNTGDFTFRQNANDKDIIFQSDDGSGGVETYFFLDGSSADANYNYTVFPDLSVAAFGNDKDLRLFHSSTNSYIQNLVGDLYIQNQANDKDIILLSDDGSGGHTAYLTLDGSAGTIEVAKTTRLADSVSLKLGSATDLELFHDGTNSFINNNTGPMFIRQNVDDGDIRLQSDDGSGGVTDYIKLDGSAGTIEVAKPMNLAVPLATASIADDAITEDKLANTLLAEIDANTVKNTAPSVYGSTIKVLPSDFMANEEPGVTKTLQFVDNDASGIKPGDNDSELLAFVSIPETMKAIDVSVYADADLSFSVYELNIHESVGTLDEALKGTGSCNTTLNITDVNATATNYLLIQVITVSKADRVWGAKVTIAAQ